MKPISIRRSRFVLVAAALLLVLLASSLALAQDSTGGFTATPLMPDGDVLTAAKPANDGISTQRAVIDPSELEVVSVIVTLDGSISPDALAAITGGEVINLSLIHISEPTRPY